MDPVSLATTFVGAQMSSTQLAVAAKTMPMNADNAASIVEVIATQRKLASLANVAAGVGQNLNITASCRPKARLLSKRCLDKPDRVLAGPFSRSSNGGDLAALRIDQKGRGHAEGATDSFEVLKDSGRRIGKVGEFLHADLVQPGLRFSGVARIDIDRHDFKSRPAQPLLERIEGRHFLATWYAPCGPQVEQHGAAPPVVQCQGLSRRILENKVRDAQRVLSNVNRSYLPPCKW